MNNKRRTVWLGSVFLVTDLARPRLQGCCRTVMKSAPVILLLLLGILLAGCSAPQHGVSSTADENAAAQVRQRLQEIFDAVKNKDFARLDSYHAFGPKFSKFSGGVPRREDAEAARQSEHDSIAALNGLVLRGEDVKVDAFGDVAVATFILNSTFESVQGPALSRALATMVFVKEGGAWKITHEHLSRANPPETAR